MLINKTWTKVKRIILQKQIALFAMLFTVLLVAKYQSNKYHEWDNPKKTFRPIVNSDGAGYFAFLPQVFIYNDHTFEFIDDIKQKYPEGKMAEFGYAAPGDGGRDDKFFPGVAICQSPFFLATHLTKNTDFPSDGYSLPYQKSIAIGAIFFLLLGLWLSYLILLHFRIQPWIAAFVLTTFTLGSTLLYYSVNEPLTAHLYSFTCIALFFYAIIRWKETLAFRFLILVVFSYALVILLRPNNGLVFILFFTLFLNVKDMWSFLKTNLFRKLHHFIPALLLFAAIIFIQFYNVKYQSGHWGFNFYVQEGFDNWKKPPFIDVLFGFRKGLFIYTPIFFLSLFGFWFFRQEYPKATLWIGIFLLLFTYVTASWWCWWYGGSIGMRPFIDVSLLFMIGLAFLIQKSKLWLKIFLLPIIAFFIYFQFILTIQMETGILHYAEMNKERFFRIFLKTDNRFQWVFFQKEPRSFDNEKGLMNLTEQWNISKKSKLVPYLKQEEHKKLETILQTPINERLKNAYGLRLSQVYTITDSHNTPWLYWAIKKNGEWTPVYIDYIGMRIPSLNKKVALNSDLFLTPEIKSADSLRIMLHNFTGLTTMEGFYADRLSIFIKK